MTLTSAADISLVFSGGSDNLLPVNSLGGIASATPITDDVLDNLFDDISADQSLSGVVDYRCIYYFNDGDTTIYSVNVFILNDFPGGAALSLGMTSQDETKRILIVGNPTSGSLTISYDAQSFVLNYDETSVMATALQNSLNALEIDGEPLLQDVSVIAQMTGSSTFFDILFTGRDGQKLHPLLVIESNDLSPVVSVSVLKIATGAPINSVAPELDNSETPPGGVDFYDANLVGAITFPKLMSGDGFPLWIQRTVAANSTAAANDGLKIRFISNSLPGS